MAQTLGTWTLFWFISSALICIWDASFILLRPATLPGGKYEAFWYPYKWYVPVDRRYGDANDEFTASISWLNYVEVVLSFIVVFLNSKGSKHTIPLAFTTTVMTFWKTVLYFLVYIVSEELRRGNTPFQHIFIFIIPNGFWILVPFLIMLNLWKSLIPNGNSNVTQAGRKSKPKRA